MKQLRLTSHSADPSRQIAETTEDVSEGRA